jgi:hypothetical protein
MAPVSQSQATKAKVVNRRDFDSQSLEGPEAALSFGPVFLVSRAAPVRLVPPYNGLYHRSGRHRPARGVMSMATAGRRVERVSVPDLTRWLKPWVYF